MEFKTYSKRPGCDDLGKDYEYKITALLALRCASLPDTENMWVGSNLDDVGDFDDTVLCRKTTDGKMYAYLAQLKHRQNPKPILDKEFFPNAEKPKKENFSLYKYYDSYIEIKDKIKSSSESSEITNYLKKCDKIFLILFTNRSASQNELLEPKEANVLNFLNTNVQVENSIFTFNSEKFHFGFLENLVLFANQVHVTDVDELIESEIKNLVGSLMFNNVDSKQISQKYLEFIVSWCKGKNRKVLYTLTKSDIINKLILLALEQYVLYFTKEQFICLENLIFGAVLKNILTVIVCDFDKFSVDFLKSHLGNEIIKHTKIEGKRRWSDHLSNEQQSTFLAKYLNANTKTLGDDKKLNIFDVYQNLWLCNKLPLILFINNAENYDNIKKICELSKCNLSLIILKDESITINHKDAVSSLSDLTLESREIILSQNVKLQGRSPICLETLITQPLHELLKFRDILYILSGTYDIGNHFETLPNHYIEQQLSKVCISQDAVVKLNTDLFLIENHPNFLMTDHSNAIQFSEGDDISIFELSTKNTHRLEYILNSIYFFWKNTFGTIKNIREFRANVETAIISENYLNIGSIFPKDCWEKYDCQFGNKHNPVHIISADAGMGKSVLMNCIASQIGTEFWVLKINLLEFESFFQKMDSLNVRELLVFLNAKILEKADCINMKLSQNIFEHFLVLKKVTILLDGFDEISVLYKYEVTRMAKQFQKGGFVVWITTRPVMKTHLEDAFNTFSVNIKPFSAQEQENYLIRYFTSVLDPEDKYDLLVNFVQELLKLARDNFGSLTNVTSVPLHITFLGEVFSKEYMNYLTSGTMSFNISFDLLYLYEEFGKKKIDILCSKYDRNAKRSRILFKKYQQLYAVQLMFSSKFLKKCGNLANLLADYSVNKEDEIQFLQREGVLILDQYSSESRYKYNVKFVHRSFAEFLAAQWLAENLDDPDLSIKSFLKVVMESRFDQYAPKFLFQMFDRIVGKNCPLHLAIINGKVENADLRYLKDLDKGGRSVLHMIALYGAAPEEQFGEVTKMKPMKDKLESLVDEVTENVDTRDKILSYNALDYSLKCSTLLIAERMCQNFGLSTVINIIKFKKLLKLFQFSVALNFTHLLKTILISWATDMILIDEYDKMFREKFYRLMFPIHGPIPFLDDIDTENIEDLFKIHDKNSTYFGFYSDIRFAVSFGSEENLQYLLLNFIDLDESDAYNNTLLYYACKFRRLGTVKLLLDRGVNVNKSCENGNTALHIAAKNGFYDGFVELLPKNANVNQSNDTKWTPIFFALMKNHYSIVAKLEEEGALINGEDDEGYNLLHIAAMAGNDDFLGKYLVKYPFKVNIQNRNGDTPLLLAAKSRNKRCVTILLANGGSSNKENFDGNIPLHFACQEGFYNITEDLLSHNANVNKQNKKQESPLFLAIKCQEEDITELLLNNGADPNLETGEGDIPFHCAIEEGWTGIVAKMILLGASLNKLNRKHLTPLNASLKYNRVAISTILIDCGVDITIKDNTNYSPLHYAVLWGNITIIKNLLQKGANMDCLDMLSHTPLQVAILFERTEVIRLLMSKNVEWKNYDIMGNSSLLLACQSGLTEIVLYFISQGADVDHKNMDDQTAFHLACEKGHLEIVQELLKQSSRINCKNNFGKTPLHLCIENKMFDNSKSYENYMSIFILLIQNGGNVNLQDRYGNSCLHYACQSRTPPYCWSKKLDVVVGHFYKDITILMLESDADASLKNVEQKTALDLALEAGHSDLAKLIQDYGKTFQTNLNEID